jgi:hypothetical protein
MALIPVVVIVFRQTRRHYQHVAGQLSLAAGRPEHRPQNLVIVPISGVHRAVLQALDYARALTPAARGVYVETEPGSATTIRRDWQQWVGDMPLDILSSPYRSLMEPLLDYIEQLRDHHPNDYITIVLPEFVPARRASRFTWNDEGPGRGTVSPAEALATGLLAPSAQLLAPGWTSPPSSSAP